MTEQCRIKWLTSEKATHRHRTDGGRMRKCTQHCRANQRKPHLWPSRAERTLNSAPQPMTEQLCPTSTGRRHKQVRQRGGRVCLHFTLQQSVHLPLHFNTLLKGQLGFLLRRRRRSHSSGLISVTWSKVTFCRGPGSNKTYFNHLEK